MYSTFQVKALFILALFSVCSLAAGPGTGTQCCYLALEAYNQRTLLLPPNNYTCGQMYAEGKQPAEDLLVPTSWVEQHCPGYTRTPSSDTSGWAMPLIQYILPAVIFSMTIPRRLVLRPPKWCFDFHLNHLNDWLQALLSLVFAGLIIIIDTTLWVFTIMIAPGPFIFSGLLELVLDFRIIRYLEGSYLPRGRQQSQNLTKRQRVQLLIAVTNGNQAIEGIPADPQIELGRVLDIDERPEETEVHLRAMLDCQYPFGAGVGAPILLYIGSFVYNLATLHYAIGDHDTARALAFGIWWMNIVHVAAISACLLATNNPSTAAAIVKMRRIKVNFRQRLGYADQHSEMEDRIEARLEAWSRLSPSYRARYEPVSMWNRGKSKASWLRRTEAWKQPWFRERIELTLQGWICLTFVAFLLILFPCALAFWIEYPTPALGIGCRALIILLYTGAQFILVVLSGWSHFKVAHDENYWKRHPWLSGLRKRWLGVLVLILVLAPAWLFAMFTTFAGTLMQITGILENYWCASNFVDGTISLASDTKGDRLSSWQWNRAGYIALIFLACVTYLGWWCQRYLREKFIERVKNLNDEIPDQHSNGQEIELRDAKPPQYENEEA